MPCGPRVWSTLRLSYYSLLTKRDKNCDINHQNMVFLSIFQEILALFSEEILISKRSVNMMNSMPVKRRMPEDYRQVKLNDSPLSLVINLGSPVLHLTRKWYYVNNLVVSESNGGRLSLWQPSSALVDAASAMIICFANIRDIRMMSCSGIAVMFAFQFNYYRLVSDQCL